MKDEKLSTDQLASGATERGAGHYEQTPIPNDDGAIARRFTVGRFVPAAARMMFDEETP